MYREFTEEVKCETCGHYNEVNMVTDNGHTGPIDDDPIICNYCGEEIILC